MALQSSSACNHKCGSISGTVSGWRVWTVPGEHPGIPPQTSRSQSSPELGRFFLTNGISLQTATASKNAAWCASARPFSERSCPFSESPFRLERKRVRSAIEARPSGWPAKTFMM
jgi:hypothetical protein